MSANVKSNKNYDQDQDNSSQQDTQNYNDQSDEYDNDDDDDNDNDSQQNYNDQQQQQNQMGGTGDSPKYIRLRGLPWSATHQEILDFLKDVNVINGSKGIHLITSRWDGKNTGEAYVEVQGQQDVEEALQLNKAMMGHRYIEVFTANPKEAKEAMRKTGSHGISYVVKLRGLPYAVTEQQIEEFFNGLEIKPDREGILFVMDRRGRATGEAFVQFESQEDTEQALGRNREKIGHRYIEIFRSSLAELKRASNGNGRPGPYDLKDRGRNNMRGGGNGDWGNGGGFGIGGNNALGFNSLSNFTNSGNFGNGFGSNNGNNGNGGGHFGGNGGNFGNSGNFGNNSGGNFGNFGNNGGNNNGGGGGGFGGNNRFNNGNSNGNFGNDFGDFNNFGNNRNFNNGGGSGGNNNNNNSAGGNSLALNDFIGNNRNNSSGNFGNFGNFGNNGGGGGGGGGGGNNSGNFGNNSGNGGGGGGGGFNNNNTNSGNGGGNFGPIGGGRGDNEYFIIHMRGLPYSCFDTDVYKFFDPIRPVNIRINFNKKGLHSGTADAYFETHEDAQLAMKRHREQMGSRYIELFFDGKTKGGINNTNFSGSAHFNRRI